MPYIGSAPTKVVSRQSATVYRYTATAGQTVFSGADLDNAVLACNPADMIVHMNGIRLESTDYTATSTSVTLVVAAAAGDEVTVTSFQTFEVADTYDKATADTRYVNASGDTMTGGLNVTGGDLLVGTTNSFGSSGITLGSNVVYAAASSQNVANFQRYTTDGEIVRFGKDGTTVGVIGTSGVDLTIGTGDVGLKFNDASNRIDPWNVSTNTSVDGTFDLGKTDRRFKDLYLSGGVYLGGVGAANLLDDYEEGTYNVTMVPQYGTITMNSTRDLAKYVKIGSLVHVSGQVRLSSVSGASGSHVTFSLPFANSSGSELSSHHWSPVSVYAFGYTNRDQGLWLYDSNSSARFLDSNYNYIPPSSFSGDEEIIFSFTYRTDA